MISRYCEQGINRIKWLIAWSSWPSGAQTVARELFVVFEDKSAGH